jgi:predicted hydrocarbon binding protein
MNDEGKMATNMSIRAAVDSITEIMGENGALIIFKDAGLEELYVHPPDYNWEPCIHVDQQTQIFRAVEKLVGLTGAVGIWRRIGYKGIEYAHEIGHLLDAFESLSEDEKYLKGSEIFAAATGKGRVIVTDEGCVDFDGSDCILCEPYHSKRPVCSVYVGILQYVADWAYGKGTHVVHETQCRAMGDATCYYRLRKKT